VFVDRLLAAGAIVIGKTNTPEFGLGCTTDNLVVGPTGTPFDPDRIAGGSSGGAVPRWLTDSCHSHGDPTPGIDPDAVVGL